ncbi:hypothetical protein F2Q68_00039698 [Brassica cretica]|uniref:Zinc finger ZPR1-type domain-containing protein n=1 Tax=Brassica cretica TaxID=69181 RepID=A0A8S9MC49_BRACR|nr:hypothetical protein F2Q68_00039698 [Brassica cretica]
MLRMSSKCAKSKGNLCLVISILLDVQTRFQSIVEHCFLKCNSTDKHLPYIQLPTASPNIIVPPVDSPLKFFPLFIFIIFCLWIQVMLHLRFINKVESFFLNVVVVALYAIFSIRVNIRRIGVNIRRISSPWVEISYIIPLNIHIPELDFEIPPEAQRGSLSTVEGILARAADELSALQEERRKVDPKTAEAIDQFLSKLRACAKAESSFTFILDDPAGNSFIENPHAPSPDPYLHIKFYERTPEQQAALGYLSNSSQTGQPERDHPPSAAAIPHGAIGAAAGHRAIAQSNSTDISDNLFRYTAPEEVMTFPSTCGACMKLCETRMFVTKIPYFQEVIVMASTCDDCGYRNSELKPGGAIPKKGKKIILSVRNIADLSRDVIKSDTAGVKIPELDLELAGGTLGGMVTTVEGLVTQIKESLARVHGFSFGDSLDESKKNKWREFGSRLTKLLSLEEPWTLILDDELANSFISPVTDDIKDDHQLTYEEYERSWEQNEELGLNDIDTSSADAAYESTETTKLT